MYCLTVFEQFPNPVQTVPSLQYFLYHPYFVKALILLLFPWTLSFRLNLVWFDLPFLRIHFVPAEHLTEEVAMMEAPEQFLGSAGIVS